MEGFTTSRIDDLPQIWDGWGKLVRNGVGITSFGCNVIDVPASTRCLDHTEAESGQEELYTALRGEGTLLIGLGEDVDAERVVVSSDTVTRVAPETRRRFLSGPDGCRLLVVGGTPGKVFVPVDME
jgi:hypothetical protein